MRRLIALLVLLPLAGCGFGAGEPTGDVTLTVTRDFGSTALHEGIDQEKASEGDTVMRLLQRKYDVQTRFGGGFVQEIDGVAGGRDSGRRADWFYYVNGIEAPVGAAERRVSAGERVWWDHHAWDAAQRVPAVVGSFPEPFKTGLEGKRFPVRLVCAGGDERSCDEVQSRLEDAGVKSLSRATLEQSAGEEVLRVRGRPLGRRAARPGRPPARARPADQRRVRAHHAAPATRSCCSTRTASPVRTLRAGGGLVAATSVQAQAPTWVVTGTDDVGVAAAAAALTSERLEQHFALAIDAGQDVPLPVVRSRDGAVIATHRRRSSPLHAARAGVAAAWCITLGLVALSFEHPLLLATMLAVTLAAAAAARVGPRGGPRAAVVAAAGVRDRVRQRDRRRATA